MTNFIDPNVSPVNHRGCPMEAKLPSHRGLSKASLATLHMATSRACSALHQSTDQSTDPLDGKVV